MLDLSKEMWGWQGVRIGGVTYVGVFGVWWFAFGGYESLCLYVELRIPFDVL